jgi:hypothetical protein
MIVCLMNDFILHYDTEYFYFLGTVLLRVLDALVVICVCYLLFDIR